MKLKWVWGLIEPALVILAKRALDSKDTSYFMDVALVRTDQANGKIEFDMRLRACFDGDKITDMDCVNISRKRFIVATVEDRIIKLYSISFENGST